MMRKSNICKSFRYLAQLAKHGISEPLTHGGVFYRLNSNLAALKPHSDDLTDAYIDEIYKLWMQHPAAVHPSWDAFFRGKCYGYPLDPWRGHTVPLPNLDTEQALIEQMLVANIVRSYQVRGHFLAALDPLGITRVPLEETTGYRAIDEKIKHQPEGGILRTYAKALIGTPKMDKAFHLPSVTFIGGEVRKLTLREILNRLEKVYCGTTGIEYMHINSLDMISWIRRRFETPQENSLTKDGKKRCLKRLARATLFEAFLAKKYPSEKRFGLEGCDVLVPCVKEIMDVASGNGIESVMIGLAHRGRLNTLANICRKPLHHIFTQFAALDASDSGSGDVKYHLGSFIDRTNRVTNKPMQVTVLANPSHLEAVDPIVEGRVRAEQFYRKDPDGSKVMSILIHGDSAFSGQGVVYETLHLSDLPDYTTHGTIHVIINNQLGFTADPRVSRSSPYCTDGARVTMAPIFHVNADDPEAVINVARAAAEWRHIFRRDVVVDLVGYRRSGHNEADEPAFTQPHMYHSIRKRKTCFELYTEKLIKEGVVTQAEMTLYAEAYNQIMEDAFEFAKKETHVMYKDWLDSIWTGFFENLDPLKVAPTGIDEPTFTHIGNKVSTPPEDEQFEIHKGLLRILGTRKAMIEEKVIDWALGEALAFGALLKEGIHVRLSGQDVERGTFSHRHHIYHDQSRDGVRYNPLQHLYPNQAPYSVSNSSLSEYAVLGFEHGFSMSNPNSLVLWEAQFGDFSNTAQCIIDQFISSGQAKWVRQSGIVMLLPHGMEGMGPEHSSARLERFLQMSTDDPDCFPQLNDEFAMAQLHDCNWIVADCTTPANYFHILRRQIALPFRKPLIIMTPKSLLRHPLAKSTFDDIKDCTEFLRLIPETGAACECPENVDYLLFCSGRVYYDLFEARAKRQCESKYAIARIEQLSPFPFDLVLNELTKYRNAKIIWVQEEHKNQGSWDFVRPRFATLFKEISKSNDTKQCSWFSLFTGNESGEEKPGRPNCVFYQGRKTAAAPATGNKKQHVQELNQILNSLFGELTEEQKKNYEKVKAEEAEKLKAKETDKSKIKSEKSTTEKEEENKGSKEDNKDKPEK